MSKLLRAHHGMCFQFYEGKGYSEDFTDHMGRIIGEMEAEPSTKVMIVAKTDLVCENCPNKVGPVCLSQVKVKKYDKKVMEACGIIDGEEMTYEEFIACVKEKVIEKGIRSMICGDCQWTDLCKSKESTV